MSTNGVQLFIGIPELSWAEHFDRSFVSWQRLKRLRGKRRKPYTTGGSYIIDSGAYTEVALHGGYRSTVEEYAEGIDRHARHGGFQCAAIQDYMCEEHALTATGLTVADHQRLTVERYNALRAATPHALMIVLQGYQPDEYVNHIEMYGDRIAHGAWVGVGSVCKRQGRPALLLPVFRAIKAKRPDLRLHGFGCKDTSLACLEVRDLLESADSMAWSEGARWKRLRDSAAPSQNDWRTAKAWEAHMQTLMSQPGQYQPEFLLA